MDKSKRDALIEKLKEKGVTADPEMSLDVLEEAEQILTAKYGGAFLKENPMASIEFAKVISKNLLIDTVVEFLDNDEESLKEE